MNQNDTIAALKVRVDIAKKAEKKAVSTAAYVATKALQTREKTDFLMSRVKPAVQEELRQELRSANIDAERTAKVAVRANADYLSALEALRAAQREVSQ